MLRLFRKITYVTVFWTFFYFFLFCLLLRSGFSYLDPDLGWHLRVGEGIAKTYQVPDRNLYNYTYTGSWVDHEWLSNYLIYKIFNNLGYPALVIFFVLLIIFVLILLNLAVTYLWREKGKSPPLFLIVIFELFGTIAALPHFGVRVQELALVFLFLCLVLIYFYNKNKNWHYLLILVPLFYLWSCLHASFLIGLFVVFAWTGVKLAERIIFNSHFKDRLIKYIDLNNVFSYKEIFIYLIFAFASFTATLFTPYYLKLYEFLTGYGNSLYMSYIQEWFSQFSFPFFYVQLFYLSFAVLAMLLYLFFNPREKINLWNFLIFWLFFILSFKSRRHFPLLFVSSFVFLIDIYGNYLRIGVGKIKSFPAWLKIYLLTCLFLTSLSILLGINFVRDPFYSSAFAKSYPHEALTYLTSHLEYNSLNIFNDYGWGGFMIYDNPGRPLFIDGRLPQVKYKNHSFLEEYLAFFRSDPEIEKKLKEYDIRLVFIKTKEQKIEAKKWEMFFFDIKDNEINPPNNLRDYLNKMPEWHKIYYDETATIYLRK